MKTSHFAQGNLLILQLLAPIQEVCKSSTLEGYFHSGNKSLDFTSHLGTNPIQLASSAGPSSRALSRAPHIGRVLLGLQGSPSRQGNHILDPTVPVDVTNLLPLFSTQIPLNSEATDERIFIEVTPFDVFYGRREFPNPFKGK